jgi:hypothetical protein
MPGSVTMPATSEAIASRAGEISLRTLTSHRCMVNSSASWSLLGLEKIISCSSSMRSSKADSEGK